MKHTLVSVAEKKLAVVEMLVWGHALVAVAVVERWPL